MIDILGITNVALFNGCFCLAFSLCNNGATPSGNDMDRDPMGLPCGLELEAGDPCEAATTSRLNPAPRRPEKAVNAELTAGGIPLEYASPDDDEALVDDGPPLWPFGCPLDPVPDPDAVEPWDGSSKGSKRDLATPAISLRRFDSVGRLGGGGGLRIPLVGGLGRRGAGERGVGGPAAAAVEASVVESVDANDMSDAFPVGCVAAPFPCTRSLSVARASSLFSLWLGPVFVASLFSSLSFVLSSTNTDSLTLSSAMIVSLLLLLTVGVAVAVGVYEVQYCFEIGEC